MKNYLLLIFSILLMSCEDKVDVTLPVASPVIVIDAWVNNKTEDQVIKITQTQPYFDSSEPKGITGANVLITDAQGNIFAFTEQQDGEYVWDPIASPLEFGIDRDYVLDITIGTENFRALSKMKRVPAVDSIKFTFKEERSPFQPEGYYGEFLATDLEGEGDTYWIKSYKNSVLLNRPFELTIAFDAGFNQGGNVDGVVFIQPIQDAVNPLNDEIDQFVPYQPGDSLYVEIHSITQETFYFLQQVQIQTQRNGGFDEIFAEPLENVQSNIEIISAQPETQVVGWFNVAAVEGNGKKLVE